MNNTNINEAVVGILTGVQSAGKEIYGASKEGLGKMVELVKEQSPELFSQFLAMKMAESVVYFTIWLLVSAFIYFVCYRVHKFESTKRLRDSEYIALKWLLGVVATIILLANLANNGTKMIKIKLAPKIYVIEYIVSSLRTVR